jgi:hypothetical protein
MALPEIQTGTAKLVGITNDGTQIAISAFATFVAQAIDLADNTRIKEEQDETDFDVTLIASNQNIEGRLTIEPSGATRAAAAAAAVFLTPLAAVQLSHFKLAALNSNYWIYMGKQRIMLNNKDSAKIELPIRLYTNAAQAAALSTTVSG